MLVMLKFYSIDKDPFRCIADHSGPLLPASYLDEEKKPDFPPALGARLLEYCVNSQIADAFEVGRSAKRVARYFLDEDGDRVVLDNRDSYLEAWKVVQKNRVSLRVIVDAQPKTDFPFSTDPNAPIPEMSRPHSVGSRTVSECSLESDAPPSWILDLVEQMKSMKQEIKDEVLLDVRKSIEPMDTASKPKKKPSPKKPKAEKSKKKEKTKSSASAQNSSVAVKKSDDCDLCCRPFNNQIRYICIRCPDPSSVCEECVQAGAHASDHVMLRVPDTFRGKPQSLAENAQQILQSHSSVCPKTSDPIAKMLVDADAVKSLLDTAQTRSVTESPDFDMALVLESETRIMNHLGGDTAAYWKRWTVENAGTKSWTPGAVQLTLQDISGPEVQPFAPEACVPALSPKGRGELVVWVYGPVTKPGKYSATWQMTHANEEGIIKQFGPILICEWEINAEEEKHEPVVNAELESNADDYSLVSVEDADFELVSNEQSPVISIASPPSTPHLLDASPESPLELLSPPNTDLNSGSRSPQPVEQAEMEQFCEQVNESLVKIQDSSDETAVSSSLVESMTLDEMPQSTVELVPDEQQETQVKEVIPPPEETVTEEPTVEAQTTTPETGAETGPNHDSVNRAFVGVARVASTALGTVGSVLQNAGRVVQQQAERRWSPPSPSTEWMPQSTAWVPRGTQTATTEAPADTATGWTPPPLWTPTTSIYTEASEGPATSDVQTNTPTTEYPEQMTQLVNMGFCDVDRNASVLRVYNGDITKTVELLVADYQVE